MLGFHQPCIDATSEVEMKIGVFSDVHGHLDELHQTLKLFETHGVNQTVCAGDLAHKGTHGDAVMAVMQEYGIPCVLGNHDAKAQHDWLTDYLQPLSDQSLKYLQTLPPEMTFNWTDISVYVCHSTPWHDPSVYVYPSRPEALFRLVAQAVTDRIIITGHTHHPMQVEIDGKTILNPGSICSNRDRTERTCGILNLPSLQFDLYDIDTGQLLPLQVIQAGSTVPSCG